jgi:hypothetical protein
MLEGAFPQKRPTSLGFGVVGETPVIENISKFDL